MHIAQAMTKQMLSSTVWIFTRKSTVCESFLSSLFCLNLLQVMIDPFPCNVEKDAWLRCMAHWPNSDKTIHNSHPSSDGGDWFQAVVFMILAIQLWSSEDFFFFYGMAQGRLFSSMGTIVIIIKALSYNYVVISEFIFRFS